MVLCRIIEFREHFFNFRELRIFMCHFIPFLDLLLTVVKMLVYCLRNNFCFSLDMFISKSDEWACQGNGFVPFG